MRPDNLPLGRVLDAISDLESLDLLNEPSRLAAKHAETLVRTAMGEPVDPGDLLRAAAWSIERANREIFR